ncbi:unnamed protein product [Adineta steineri]|uniref:Uncharacterized protein n=1 Tax=Adineta steineri TaxID=433720 RepID=A0A814S0C5_9BILA|nr:unnamed protein product [Adineta steineri]
MDSTSIDFIDEIYICSTDNEKKEFERIHGFISCTKFYHTSVYRPKSGTKRFIDHANQCSPLASQSTTSPNDLQATQSTLDKIVIKRQITITTKEQNGKQYYQIYGKQDYEFDFPGATDAREASSIIVNMTRLQLLIDKALEEMEP